MKKKGRITTGQDATDKARLAAAKEIEERIGDAVDGNGHLDELAATSPPPKRGRGKQPKAHESLPASAPEPGGADSAPEATAKRKPGKAPREAAGASTSKAPKSAKAPKAPKEPKRLSALDAAAQVLAASKKPMRATEIVAAMAKQGLWKSPGGKTPESTLYAALLREVQKKGPQARFRKVERGQFAINGKEG